MGLGTERGSTPQRWTKQNKVYMSKEWSGNSKSVRVMNGCSNNVDRAAGDYYTTDPAAVEEFLDALGWWKSHPEKKGMVVWEPDVLV